MDSQKTNTFELGGGIETVELPVLKGKLATIQSAAPEAPGLGSKKAYLLSAGAHVYSYSSSKYIGQITYTEGHAGGKVTVTKPDGSEKQYSGGTTFKYAPGTLANDGPGPAAPTAAATPSLAFSQLDASAMTPWTPENLNGYKKGDKLLIHGKTAEFVEGSIPGSAEFLWTDGPLNGVSFKLNFDEVTGDGWYKPIVFPSSGGVPTLGESLQTGDYIAMPNGDMAKVSIKPDYPNGGSALTFGVEDYDLDPHGTYKVIAPKGDTLANGELGSEPDEHPLHTFSPGDSVMITKSAQGGEKLVGELVQIQNVDGSLVQVMDGEGTYHDLTGTITYGKAGKPVTAPFAPGDEYTAQTFAKSHKNLNVGDQFVVTATSGSKADEKFVGQTITVGKIDAAKSSFDGLADDGTPLGFTPDTTSTWKLKYLGATWGSPTGDVEPPVGFGVEAPLYQQVIEPGDAFTVTDAPNKAFVGSSFVVTGVHDGVVYYDYFTGFGKDTSKSPHSKVIAETSIVVKKLGKKQDIPQPVEQVLTWAKPGDVLIIDATAPNAAHHLDKSEMLVKAVDQQVGYFTGEYITGPYQGKTTDMKITPLLFSNKQVADTPPVSLDSFDEGATILIGDKPGTVGKTLNGVTLVHFDDGTADIFTDDIPLAKQVGGKPGGTTPASHGYTQAKVTEILEAAPTLTSPQMGQQVTAVGNLGIGDIIHNGDGKPEGVVVESNMDKVWVLFKGKTDPSAFSDQPLYWSAKHAKVQAAAAAPAAPESPPEPSVYSVGSIIDDPADVASLPVGSVVLGEYTGDGTPPPAHEKWAKVTDDGLVWILPNTASDGKPVVLGGVNTNFHYTVLFVGDSQQAPLTTEEAKLALDNAPNKASIEAATLPSKYANPGMVTYTKMDRSWASSRPSIPPATGSA